MNVISTIRANTLRPGGKILCSLFFIFFQQHLQSQCGGGDQFPNYECENAPLMCLQNWCFESTNEILVGFPGFCGSNTIVNNPQYYAFFALSEDIEIEIHVENCSNGSGLQGAIIGNCPWYDAGDIIDCNPGTPTGGTIVLHSYGFLVPGQTYWLLIDGTNGAFCNYTITSVSGIYMPEIYGEITQVTVSEDSVPQGYKYLELEAITTVSGEHGYYWVLGWNGDTIISTGPYTTIDIPCDLDPGIYDVCVRAFSGCDTTDYEVCTLIEVFDEPDTIIKPTSTFCLEEFPFFWHNLLINAPGTYTKSFTRPGLCPIDTTWEVLKYPEVAVGQIDTTICGQEFTYEGEVYYQNGYYYLEYHGQSANGCDSTAELHLTFHSIDLFVQSLCIDSQLTMRAYIIKQSPLSDSIIYSWFDCHYDSLLSTSMEFVPDTTGCYCLVTDFGACHDTICSNYEPSSCDVACNLVKETLCKGEPVLFTADSDIPTNTQFHWLFERPGISQPYYFEADSLTFQFFETGHYRVSLTIVDSTNTFTCTDSFYVEESNSTASICCDTIACDTCTTITIELTGTPPWTLYISDGTSMDTIAGITTSPYLYVACPPLDTTISYSIEVTDSIGICPGKITGDGMVNINLYSIPDVSIHQSGDTLCASLDEMNTYNWFNCVPQDNLATTKCFIPPSSGCYCVEVTTANGCADTTCYDFIISVLSPIQTNLMSISPVPSDGTWNVNFSTDVELPVEWELVNLWGAQVEQGKLENQKSILQLTGAPPSGLYMLKFISEDRQRMTAKVILQSE